MKKTALYVMAACLSLTLVSSPLSASAPAHKPATTVVTIDPPKSDAPEVRTEESTITESPVNDAAQQQAGAHWERSGGVVIISGGTLLLIIILLIILL